MTANQADLDAALLLLSRMSRRVPRTQPRAVMTVPSATRPLQSIVAVPYTVDRTPGGASCGTGNARRAFTGPDRRPLEIVGGTTADTTRAVTTPTPGAWLQKSTGPRDQRLGGQARLTTGTSNQADVLCICVRGGT